MPQLLFKGVSTHDLIEISTSLIESLSTCSDIPKDHFTLECPTSEFIYNGSFVHMYPLIEVKWFDRGIDMQHNFARLITSALKARGYESVEVYFVALSKSAYYDNAVPFE